MCLGIVAKKEDVNLKTARGGAQMPSGPTRPVAAGKRLASEASALLDGADAEPELRRIIEASWLIEDAMPAWHAKKFALSHLARPARPRLVTGPIVRRIGVASLIAHCTCAGEAQSPLTARASACEPGTPTSSTTSLSVGGGWS